MTEQEKVAQEELAQVKAKIRELLSGYTQEEKTEILTALCKENGVPTLFD